MSATRAPSSDLFLFQGRQGLGSGAAGRRKGPRGQQDGLSAVHAHVWRSLDAPPVPDPGPRPPAAGPPRHRQHPGRDGPQAPREHLA